MQQIFTGSRFMVFWILGSLAAIFVTVLVTGIAAVVASILVGTVFVTGIVPPMLATNIIGLVAFAGIGAVMGLVTGSIQMSVIQQKWSVEFKGWRVLSVLGGLTGVLLTAVIIGLPLREAFLTLTLPSRRMLMIYGAFPFVLPLACLSLAQLPVMMRYARAGWLWITGNIVAGLVMYALMVSLISGTTLLFWVWLLVAMAVAPGIVTGFTMFWLLEFNRKDMWPGDYI